MRFFDNILKHNIPYKYECPMLLDNGTVRYPEFSDNLLGNKEIEEIINLI